MKKVFLLFLLLTSLQHVFSQSRFDIGNKRYKYLPFETSLFYRSSSNIGVKIAVENQIIEREKFSVILGKPIRTKKEVLTRFNFIPSTFSKNKDRYLELNLGFSTSFRKTFGSGFQIEPILGYSYGYAFNISQEETSKNSHSGLLQFGFGYTASQKRFTTTLFFIRPGIAYPFSSSIHTNAQFICDVGVQYFVKSLRVKPWKNPWFTKKSKPNDEFEFTGKLAGEKSSENISDKKRYKLNKKKRKYKTGRKKIKNKKKKNN